MNISKSVGIVTTAIPIIGILVGGITFGVNFKTDVETIKEDIANQKAINETIPSPYDDSLLWLSIDNIDIPDIPEGYDDSNISKRIQLLEIDLAELTVLLEGVDVGEEYDDSSLRGRIAELEGSLQAVSNIEVDDNGTIDIAPLIVRIATLEGSIQTVRTDIKSMKADIKTNERTASAASNNSGSSRTVENRYDDSDLRSRVSAVERQVNAIPTTTSSSGGTTIQRVENPFDDASLRSDISALQTAVAVLQATPPNSYDDSYIQDRIDDIQWQLDTMDIQVVASDNNDTGWLEDLIYQIKEELTWRIDELEWASDTTTTSDDMYAQQWMVEDLQYEVMYIQEQVWELQELANEYQNSTNNGNNSSTTANSTSTMTAGRSWDGSWDEPYWLYVDHNESSYTGDYYMDGYWDGEPVWINWECGIANTQFEWCYIFKYNYVSWVIQPLAPSNEWLANAYTDLEFPWSGTWNGGVNSVHVKGE